MLDDLQPGNQRPRTCLLNAEADEAYLERMQCPVGVRRTLAHLPRDQVLDDTTLTITLFQHHCNGGSCQQDCPSEIVETARKQ